MLPTDHITDRMQRSDRNGAPGIVSRGGYHACRTNNAGEPCDAAEGTAKRREGAMAVQAQPRNTESQPNHRP